MKTILLHLADIHIRDSGRATFSVAISGLRTYVERIERDTHIVALIVGDLFHGKTQLSAENIADCYLLINTLALRAHEIIVMPGNHDANLNNHERLDLPHPLLQNYHMPGNCRLFYLQHSGWYDNLVPGMQFYAFSPLDVPEDPGREHEDGSGFKIALVHEFIDGLNFGGVTHRSGIRAEWLTKFDATFCGHIHDYMPLANNIVYCGALTQLTVGETFEKGFVVWNAGDKLSHTFVRLEVPGAQIKIILVSASVRASASRAPFEVRANIRVMDARVDIIERIPADSSRVVIEIRVANITQDSPEMAQFIEKLRARVPGASIEFVTHAHSATTEVIQRVEGGNMERVQKELIVEKLRAIKGAGIDEVTINDVLLLHKQICTEHVGANAGARSWYIEYIEWTDLFCFAGRNFINFANSRSIVGLTAPNRSGKSAIIDILVLALFGETLRGSAAAIIRRGCLRGSLRCRFICIAGANAGVNTMHEIIRSWDTKGRGDMKYLIDGQDKTAVDLRATYDIVARSIGTLEDFQCAALMPQHYAESFIDMTDTKKRIILSRVLGLDVLENAQEIVTSRIAEKRGALRELSAMISEIEGRADPEVMRARTESLERIRADESALRARIEKMEAMPAVAQPVRTQEQARADIAKYDARIAEIMRDIAKVDADISDAKARMVPLLDAARETSETLMSAEDLDKLRAQQIKISSSIDAHSLVIGHSTDFALAGIPAKLEVARAKLDKLMRVREIREKMRAPCESDKRLVDEFPNLDAFRELFRDGTVLNVEGAREIERIMREEFAQYDDVARWRACRCEGSGTLLTQDEREMLVQKCECCSFASGVTLPEDCARTIDDCLRGISREVEAFAKSRDASRAMSCAHCAISLVRLVGANADMSKLDVAQFCAKRHARIDARLRAEERLRKAQKLVAVMIARDVISANARAMCEMRAIDSIACNMDSRDLGRAIFETERAIALFAEINENGAKITLALAQELEAKKIEVRIRACFTARQMRDTYDAYVAKLARIRATHDEVSAKRAECVAECALIERAWVARKQYETHHRELCALRQEHAAMRAVMASYVAEVAEYAATRERLRELHARMTGVDRENHILSLYRTTIDTKTGIQFTMMMRAIDIIERETNRFLEPIAGLRLRIIMGSSDLSVTESRASSEGARVPKLARSIVNRAMRLTVLNIANGTEHIAELCSGFQRFILNIALRRAFLYANVRASPQFMLIDEGFGCLDEINMTCVCERITELARELRYMMIISHRDELRAITDSVVAIAIGETSSHIESGAAIAAPAIDAQAVSADVVAKVRAKADAKARAKLSARAPIDDHVFEARAEGAYFCKICESMIKSATNIARHLISKKHIKRRDARGCGQNVCPDGHQI